MLIFLSVLALLLAISLAISLFLINRMKLVINTYGEALSRINEEFNSDNESKPFLIKPRQNNRKIDPLELARLYTRLESLGRSNKDIATAAGITEARVAQIKAYDNMPTELKTLVSNAKIEVDAAMELFNKHGTKAVKVAKVLIEKTVQAGGTKVTHEDIHNEA
jgi:hypothetical protein